jgi:hypothetical protein
VELLRVLLALPLRPIELLAKGGELGILVLNLGQDTRKMRAASSTLSSSGSVFVLVVIARKTCQRAGTNLRRTAPRS